MDQPFPSVTAIRYHVANAYILPVSEIDERPMLAFLQEAHIPTVSLDVISLVASSADVIGVKSSNTLRNNSRCTWRHR